MSIGRKVSQKLLIVDDDHSLRQILCWAFEDLGYRVWGATDCREAASRAAAMSFDFALLDYRLPDGDGHALSRTLARILPKLHSVLMSAERGAADTVALIRCEAGEQHERRHEDADRKGREHAARDDSQADRRQSREQDPQPVLLRSPGGDRGGRLR